ncbi:diaminobutyrate--2-oxoglutarate transaminase [Streptomyces spiroverticillatus]|uniref:Diaminobutyrate--2-oxoglutarate transaminase n=1 Tax=Streptomyces finlayi TaxID=67296 RepID=A0A919CAC1_9ACTN|nr:diaminobutyrate--2-oxoglutarate transaminase [Streptomyces finlayi]GHA11606.1 diaminobutyrate--2-oxoglutarate transaminase [Streptomyces spiroverticillatus]GHC94937.1 diaminobutyrate--2-oxoglutarate transaminase [Streptomyces finlayi]
MVDLKADTAVFTSLESEVRSYCRAWPTVFTRAQGSHMYDEGGRAFLDFFVGAGTLNYGHNNPVLKRALIEYLTGDGITHSLDMFTGAKRSFLQAFEEFVLRPRGLDHKVMFPGPSGTNAVEAALKLARKVTGREAVVSFTNAFHGMSLGAMSVSGSGARRKNPGIPRLPSYHMPFDTQGTDEEPDFRWFTRLLEDKGSGFPHPAAVIVETVQGEGGINVARPEWLRALDRICKRHDMLLIVDDIQMGCGRTGTFFSFEEAGIVPDIVTLSKSLSGYGLPLAVTLLRPELDVWEPGEHNGTFRGPNPAFVTATAALHAYWADAQLEKQIFARGEQTEEALRRICRSTKGEGTSMRGRGLVWGLAFDSPERADAVRTRCFERGLVIETAGPRDEVVKLLPPLTCTADELDWGLDLITRAVTDTA